MQYRHSVLSAAILATLAFSAQAQQAGGDATDLDAVQVVGIRASLEKSLDTKRNNVTVSEAITAEDIGKFPSTNVAEAFAQIPGVTIDRRFGQGERVSIDGTDPSLNLSFLDGHPVAQAIWLYGEQPNRGFDYTLLSPQILGRAEIVKSSEARLVEGSLGGTVLMHSRQPLDLKANEIAGSVGYSYSQQASEGKPNASLLYSWKNPQQTFGIAVSAQHYEERVDRQGMEVFGYAKAAAFGNAGGVPADADVPNSVNAAWFQQDRKRDSAVVNLQLKPSDALEFNLSGLYIKENFDNYNQSMYSFLTWNQGTIDAVDALGSVRNGVVGSGHSGANANAGGGTVIYDNNVRQSEVVTKGIDLRGAFRGEGWGVSGQIGQSKSDNKDLSQYFIEPFYNGGFSWDLQRGIRFDDAAGARDPANWGSAGGWFGNNGIFATHSKDRYGQLDFNLQFDSVFNQLLFGVRQGKHDEDFTLNVYGGVTPGTLADVGTIGLTDIQGFYPDQGRHVQAGRGNVIDWIRNSPVDYADPDPASYLNNSWALQQTNNAAYVQLNFSNGGLRGNLGVRYVDSKTEGSGFVYSGTPTLDDLDSKWQTRTRKEHFLLPSLNLAYDTDTDWVFRFAAGKVIAWAPYNQMVNNTFLNDTTLTGSGGNAALSPYESWNFNLSAEYYFAQQAVVAWSLFYKKIDNYIDTSATIERQYNSIRDTSPQTWAQMLGSNGCSADGYCDYSIQRPRNAGDGKVKGFTLAYQQPFGSSGFGLTANYTYANGENNTGDRLPYQSRNSVAFSPYYEKGPWNARISLNWRDSYLAGGYVAGAAPASVDDYTDLGASIGYAISDQWSLQVDAQNLLDEEYFQYLGDKDHPAGRYKNGRRYMATLHFKF
ncbi:TonB-dependent receptor [Xanthomonas sp. SI]|uniref:TonB-dependent receptor n=1 Tax=Xanthomonas sp. SI TaxID=2724123 RepID=UPI001639726B|nr:TonB-dependent receptor [Xanthomonas sp. SI]QNH11334.1 TonB-dependent receptor [Xanthomonas sp. SI]